MKKTLFILIFLLSIGLVSAITCDEGDTSTTCNITSTYAPSSGEVINANNLIIKSTGIIKNSVDYTINLTGDLIVQSGGEVSSEHATCGGGRDIIIESDSINISGSIDASALSGFSGCTNGLYGGDIDIISNDLYLDGTINSKGGGALGTRWGGNGGVITINSTNFIEASGDISVKGGYQPQRRHQSGGGGDIILEAENITLSGIIDATKGYSTTTRLDGSVTLKQGTVLNISSATITPKPWLGDCNIFDGSTNTCPEDGDCTLDGSYYCFLDGTHNYSSLNITSAMLVKSNGLNLTSTNLVISGFLNAQTNELSLDSTDMLIEGNLTGSTINITGDDIGLHGYITASTIVNLDYETTINISGATITPMPWLAARHQCNIYDGSSNTCVQNQECNINYLNCYMSGNRNYTDMAVLNSSILHIDSNLDLNITNDFNLSSGTSIDFTGSEFNIIIGSTGYFDGSIPNTITKIEAYDLNVDNTLSVTELEITNNLNNDASISSQTSNINNIIMSGSGTLTTDNLSMFSQDGGTIAVSYLTSYDSNMNIYSGTISISTPNNFTLNSFFLNGTFNSRENDIIFNLSNNFTIGKNGVLDAHGVDGIGGFGSPITAGGNVLINADVVNIQNILNASGGSYTSLGFVTGGDGGNININSNYFYNDGIIDSTGGTGNRGLGPEGGGTGGNITINSTNLIEIQNTINSRGGNDIYTTPTGGAGGNINLVSANISIEGLLNVSKDINSPYNDGRTSINYTSTLNITQNTNITPNPFITKINPSYGYVAFNNTLNYTTDIDSYTTISLNDITIDSSSNPDLDVNANLQLKNLDTLTNCLLVPYKDGSPCGSDCNVTKAENGILEFSVTGFTTYSDGTCDEQGPGGDEVIPEFSNTGKIIVTVLALIVVGIVASMLMKKKEK